MNLNLRTKEYLTQNEILYTTQGAIAKVGNITLDGSLFTAGSILKAGTAVSVKADGLCKPFADADTGKVYLTSHDVVMPDVKGPVIVGAWEEALVQDAKLTGVTAAFKTKAGSRYRFL